MRTHFWILLSIIFLCGCQSELSSDEGENGHKGDDQLIKKYLSEIDAIPIDESSAKDYDYMSLIPGAVFNMGGDNDQALPDELPNHKVKVDSFWMDKTEVTNKDFRAFTEATGYKTIAERKLDPKELLNQMPPGTRLPDDFDDSPISLVFKKVIKGQLANPNTWWQPVRHANWRHPEGENSTIEGKDYFPAVHIAWVDAAAYCKWRGKRLPTEAEWEFASRGRRNKQVFHWGNALITPERANYWQGEFPYLNTNKDGHAKLAPVMSYMPNSYFLYDTAGNVWEWCSDWYKYDHYKERANADIVENPAGPTKSFDPLEPSIPKKVMRGGSFLCNDSYCSGYRVAARMKSSPDTGLEHTGCRCVRSI